MSTNYSTPIKCKAAEVKKNENSEYSTCDKSINKRTYNQNKIKDMTNDNEENLTEVRRNLFSESTSQITVKKLCFASMEHGN